MLVISGKVRPLGNAMCLVHVSISQSRCLSFQVRDETARPLPDRFQSRNRDACHFRSIGGCNTGLRYFGFNLAIEMLVISGRVRVACKWNAFWVSISQSRCLSFQVRRRRRCRHTPHNRFNLAIEMLVISGTDYGYLYPFSRWDVSISQSRCLSFQVSLPACVPGNR